jgi:hypothetical protein
MGLTPVMVRDDLAMKVYMLILLLGTIATFAHMSSLSQSRKSERLS